MAALHARAHLPTPPTEGLGLVHAVSVTFTVLSYKGLPLKRGTRPEQRHHLQQCSRLLHVFRPKTYPGCQHASLAKQCESSALIGREAVLQRVVVPTQSVALARV